MSCRPHHITFLIHIGFDKLFLTTQEAQRLLQLVEEALIADLEEIEIADITLSLSDAYRLSEALQEALVAPGRVGWQWEGF